MRSVEVETIHCILSGCGIAALYPPTPWLPKATCESTPFSVWLSVRAVWASPKPARRGYPQGCSWRWGYGGNLCVPLQCSRGGYRWEARWQSGAGLRQWSCGGDCSCELGRNEWQGLNHFNAYRVFPFLLVRLIWIF
jgi:hypothetical protein